MKDQSISNELLKCINIFPQGLSKISFLFDTKQDIIPRIILRDDNIFNFGLDVIGSAGPLVMLYGI